MPKRPSPPKIRGIRQQRRQKPAAQDATLINIRAMKKRHALLEARVEALERLVFTWSEPPTVTAHVTPGPPVGTMPQNDNPLVTEHEGLPSYPTITDKVGD